MADGATFESTVSIAKVDLEKRHVFGIFSVSMHKGVLVKDGEGDEIEPDELEAGAYGHVLEARIAGDNHVRKGVGDLIESFVITPEKIAAMTKAFADSGIEVKIDIPAVAWWGGYFVHDDDVWGMIKRGDYSCLSIGGSCNRVADDA